MNYRLNIEMNEYSVSYLGSCNFVLCSCNFVLYTCIFTLVSYLKFCPNALAVISSTVTRHTFTFTNAGFEYLNGRSV